MMKMLIMKNHLCVLVLGLASRFHVGMAVSASDMKTHLTNTFNNYDTRVRPVYSDQSNAVHVTMDLYVIGINSFDSAEQKLTTTAYLHNSWKDEILQNRWHNINIDNILIGQKNIWLPDIALQNGFESLSGLGNSFLLVKVDKTGTVTWQPYQVFEIACTVDVTLFPFDKTKCELKFIVWSNTRDLVDVTVGATGINTASFEDSAEWSILSTAAAEFTTSSSSGVTFTIELKRKPLFYLLNILVPVIMLAVINVFVFMLPASSGEKTGLAVTVFLAFAVFMTIISAELPKTSDKISMFAAYLFLMTLVSTLIVIVTIVQLRLHSREPEQPIPNWLQGMTRFVRRLSCRRCCRRGDGYHAFDADEIRERLAADVTWESVCDSLDFYFFWLFLALVVIITITCITMSVFGAI